MRNKKMRIVKSPLLRQRQRLKSRLWLRIICILIGSFAWLSICALADKEIIDKIGPTLISVQSFFIHLMTVIIAMLSFAYIRKENQMWNELGSMYLILVFSSLAEAWSLSQIPVILPSTALSVYIISRLVIKYIENKSRLNN